MASRNLQGAQRHPTTALERKDIRFTTKPYAQFEWIGDHYLHSGALHFGPRIYLDTSLDSVPTAKDARLQRRVRNPRQGTGPKLQRSCSPEIHSCSTILLRPANIAQMVTWLHRTLGIQSLRKTSNHSLHYRPVYVSRSHSRGTSRCSSPLPPPVPFRRRADGSSRAGRNDINQQPKD